MATSRMNGLKITPSKTGNKGTIAVTSNLGTLGSKVNPLKPSNNPGPMTAPSAQGPTRPKRT